MKTTKTALTSSIVKKHKTGVLSDTSPHVGLRLVATKMAQNCGCTDTEHLAENVALSR
jgi:hypothetical protein